VAYRPRQAEVSTFDFHHSPIWMMPDDALDAVIYEAEKRIEFWISCWSARDTGKSMREKSVF
jgi:hypothetical protein